jgi:hypothetical protein
MMWVCGQSKQRLDQALNGMSWGMQLLLLGLARSQSGAGMAAGMKDLAGIKAGMERQLWGEGRAYVAACLRQGCV